MKLEELDTPVLLVDRDALERNLKRMQEITAAAGVSYRPHAKAHKSPDIAKLQFAHGATGICCAKLGEAEVLCEEGIQNILITTPVIGLSKLARLAQLASRTAVAVVADDAQNLREMGMIGQTTGVALDVVIEVNVGQNRCGVEPGEPALALARIIEESPWLALAGLQGYQGAIQMTEDFAERKAAAEKALSLLLETATLIRANGIEVPVLTGGGSGTSAIDAAAHGLTELQPGGYIFMDARYRQVDWEDGDKIPFESSLTVLASVISRPAPNRAILDMGLKSISSDQGPPVPLDLPGAQFKFAGEEHGELFWEEGDCPLENGDKVRFVPTHCDTTVNLYDQFIAYAGEDVTDVWPIPARGRSQ